MLVKLELQDNKLPTLHLNYDKLMRESIIELELL